MRMWSSISMLAVLWLLCVGASQAHADPITIAVAGYIGVELAAGTVLTSVLTFAWTTAAAVGLSYLSSALSAKAPGSAGEPEVVGGTVGKLQSGGAVPRSFIVGRAMTAGSLVYANTFGSDGNTPNAYLVQVIALSDIPVEGLAEIWIQGEKVTWDPMGTPGSEGIPIPEYNKDGRDYLWVRFYDGTQNSYDGRLAGVFGSNLDRPYGTTRVGFGVAYVAVTALVNQELFGGFPTCKFVLDGIKLYDRRFDSTNGGSGTQRLSDPTTWAFTKNNAVIIENIFRGIDYDDKWLYGAQTVTSAQLPGSSWIAGANECDLPVDLAEGGTEVQFAAGGEIRLDTQPADAIEELLKACNGRVAEIGGVYKIRVGAAGSSVLSFTDVDVLSTESQTFDPFPSLGQAVNYVTAKYTSPVEGWNPKDAAPLQDDDLEAADGGRRQGVDVSYGFVQSGTAVQRLMRAERDSQRAWRRHAVPMPPDAFVLEPLDVVSWTSTRNGYADKLFEVISADDLPNFNVGLALKEIDPSAYDWDPETDEVPVVDGTISIVPTPPQPIIDWFADPYTLTSGEIERPAILLGWDPNTDDVDGVRFEIRKADTGVVVHSGTVDLHGFLVGQVIESQSLLPATEYEARGQYRPASPRPMTWSDWLPVTTPDTRIGPGEFEAGLRDQVTLEFKRATDAFDRAIQLIASVAAEQDAANAIDKTETRRLLTVTRDNLTASIEAVETVAVSTESAFASFSTTVSASFGDLTAFVSETATAVANVAGEVGSLYTLSVNSGAKIAGFKLGNDGVTADLAIEVDNFLVGKSATMGGTFVPVFAIADVAGSPKIVIRGDLLADGTITAQKISAGAVTAGKLFAGAINAGNIIVDDIIVTGHLTADAATALNYVQGADVTTTFANGSVIDLTSLSITTVTGKVVFNCNTYIDNSYGSAAGGSTLTLELYIDGVLQSPSAKYPTHFDGFTAPATITQGFHETYWLNIAVSGLSAGSHTIELKARMTQSSGFSLGITYAHPMIVALESRR